MAKFNGENWRVVREWSNIGEVGFLYRFHLEDIYPGNRPDVHPFVKHDPGPLEVIGDDPERLRARLKAMLAALDEPVLEWTQRQLIEKALNLPKAS